ncbi:transglutaminase domain-containing protein [Bacteroides sp. AN502(2024)]|uniref:transglutaminase domain-containing protein n=1 Tax=Bacteroides sp. AN502(2024) TaxID=3160599 RepID=UPI0035165177
MKTIFKIILCVFLASCSSLSEKTAWEIANQSKTNRKELTNFLKYYKNNNDKTKYKAACFLVENMPNKYSFNRKGQKIYDIDIVKADSLILSLEYSFYLKKKSPYLKEYTFEQFCEYILPYRVANEPLQYYWKWDCVKRFGDGNNNNIINAAQNINSQIKIELSPEFYKDTLKTYTSIVQSGYGKCDDRSTLVVMALRSAGIPAAFELVPYWGSSNNGHSFATMILPNGGVVSFQNDNKNDNNTLPIRKMPKIYRKIYTIIPRQTFDNTQKECPELFANCDIIDVTGIHHIGSITVPVANYVRDRPIYLSVFSPNAWIPVAMSYDEEFKYIGTGTLKGKEESEEALNLGNGILYLPSTFLNCKIIPQSNPIIVSDDGIKQLYPDTLHKETVILNRKYPLNKRIVKFASNMIGGMFEGANYADFSDAEAIYIITETPKSRMQKVKVSTSKKYRYIRYRKPKGTFSIAEFSLFCPDGTSLSFSPISCEAIQKDSNRKMIFDQDPLTYYQVDGGIDMWIGGDLGKAVKIGLIGFAPRNDDNSIVPTDTYELFYWDGQWNSLGKKTSTENQIIFNNVPKDALLWLRDLTKGREERPFTFENGQQIWW